MAGSILIYGSSKEERKKKMDKIIKDFKIDHSPKNPDLRTITTLEKKRSIGIQQIRETINYLNEKPFSSKHKVVIIDKAELLTTPAQNALLKSLEEPPEYATIILNAKTEETLLATVTSRCKKVRAKDSKKGAENLLNVGKIIEMNIGERLSWAGEYSKEDKEIVIETLENWIHKLRKSLDSKNAANIEIISKIKKDLESTNVSTKLALELLVLSLR